MSSISQSDIWCDELAACRHLSRTGRARKALLAARKLLRHAQAAALSETMARAAEEIAWCCVQLGRADEGIAAIRKAHHLWIELSHLRDAARSSTIYARLLFEIGLSDAALREASEALHVARTVSDIPVQVLALDVQAITMIASGEMATGERLLDEALTLQRDVGDHCLHVMLLIHKALMNAKIADGKLALHGLQAVLGSYASAIELNERAIEIASAHGDGHGHRLALTNLAEVFAAVGDLANAHKRLDQWLLVPGEPGDNRMVHYLYTRTELLARFGRYEEALEYGRQALHMTAKIANADHEAHVHRRLCDVYEGLGDFRRALNHHRCFYLAEKRTFSERAQRQARVVEAELGTEKLRAHLDRATERAKRLAQEVLLDPLTGAANRRALDQGLRRLTEETGTPYTIAIVDLDHFKLINDTFSHLVGDAVLQEVAQILQRCCRKNDLVARVGGEEFAVLLPHLERGAAIEVCERIRGAVCEADWEAVAPGLVVTASLGLADSSEREGPHDVYRLADARLYAAKAGGRNRVEFKSMTADASLATLH